MGLKGALPTPLFSKKQYPNLYAWNDRFDKELAAAKSRIQKPTTMEGADAIKHITQADFCEPEGKVDETDPLGLPKGQDVEVWPIDSGFKHRDRGSLVALTEQEVVLSTQSKIGNKEIRIHYPRTNFRIQAVSGGEESKL